MVATRGQILPKPIDCPEAIYDIMRDCWNVTPENRPSFENLKDRFMSGDLFKEGTSTIANMSNLDSFRKQRFDSQNTFNHNSSTLNRQMPANSSLNAFNIVNENSTEFDLDLPSQRMVLQNSMQNNNNNNNTNNLSNRRLLPQLNEESSHNTPIVQQQINQANQTNQPAQNQTQTQNSPNLDHDKGDGLAPLLKANNRNNSNGKIKNSSGPSTSLQSDSFSNYSNLGNQLRSP